MSLSEKHLKRYCLLNQGARQCRFLRPDDSYEEKYFCFKLTPLQAEINEQVENYLRNCKNTGTDPYGGHIALGDNCDGYIPLKYIEQGYDQPQP